MQKMRRRIGFKGNEKAIENVSQLSQVLKMSNRLFQ